MQPDTGLSPAARDVLHELEVLAREHPDATGPELARLLAEGFMPRLKRQWWWQR